MPKRIYKLKDKIYRFSEDEILNGKIGRTIAYLSIPLILGNTAFIVYDFVDLFWLGKLGTNVLAAMAFTSPILSLFFALGAGIITAGGILAGQYRGAKDKEGVDFAVTQTIVFTFILAVFLAVLGIAAARPLLILLKAPSEIIPLACSYLYVALPGIILTYGFFLGRIFFRSMGNSILPMFLGFLSAGLAVLIEPFLIFGLGPFPELGFVGSKTAIMLGEGMSFLIGFFLLWRGFLGIRARRSFLLPDWAFIKCLLRLGLPISAEIAVRSLGANIVLPVVALFGTEAVASFGIGSRFLNIGFVPALGLSQAIGVITVQNLGAKRNKRVLETVKKGIAGAFLGFGLIGLVCFWKANEIALIFTADPKVLQMSVQLLKILSLSFGFLAGFRIFVEVFRASGAALSALFVSFFAFAVFQPCFAFLLSRFFQETGIWWTLSLTNLASALLALICFVRIKQKLHIFEEAS